MRARLVLSVTLASVLFTAAACTRTVNGGRSEAEAVKQALQQADLKDVTVSDDADKSTITLGGTLHSDEAKARAGEVAKSAASNRVIANEISVQPLGSESDAKAVASNLDDGIENNYKAALISHHLDKLSIHYKAKNGVLVLTGTVKNAQQRHQAEALGAKIPNVNQVVNQLEVRS
jgi:osmotically-inducible protein OsmY